MATKRHRTFRLAAWGLLAAALAIGGCDRHPALPPPATEPAPPTHGESAMNLQSPAFADGQRIPKKYTGEGDDRSPPLEWTDPPEGTKAFALICDDPDAPRGTWDHWLLWNLPGALRQLSEGVPTTRTLPDLGGAVQGSNSWPKIGYGGPMPPPGHPGTGTARAVAGGTHHYHFVLYALDAALDLKPGAAKAALQKAMKGHVLAEARLMGTYSR